MKILKIVTLILLGGVFLPSCANVTPVIDERRTSTFDGNQETAGVLEFNADGSLKITESGRKRYNSIVSGFGSKTYPPTEEDFGITSNKDGTYNLTLEGADRWHKLILLMQAERINNAK